MSIPGDRKYSATHEWFKVAGDTVTFGITQYAADELTDITYVELPPPGTRIGPGEPCGGVESVKAYSELYTAVEGEISEVNTALEENPGLVNSDAFGEGWMFRFAVGDASGLEKLMDAAAYERHIASKA